MPAILSDAELLNEHPDALDSADDVFAALFGNEPAEGKDAPKKEPSDEETEESNDQETDDDHNEDGENSDQETDPEDEDEDETDDEGNEDEQAEDDTTPAKKFADDGDDTYVKIKVGDKEEEVKVSDLKRLWGQEASLTRKSQEAADLRRVNDAQQAKNLAAYDVILKKATTRADSFRNLPWTQLMKDQNVPADQLTALQEEARGAFEEEAFLKNEIDGFMKQVDENQKVERGKAAAECIKALSDAKSPHHVKGWGEAMYNDIRSFAVDQGLPKEMVNQLTDPGAFKILHMAMQFSRGAKKVVTKKVNKQPTRIVKNSASAPAARTGSGARVKADKAVNKAIKSGATDDALNAFLALEGED